MREILLLDIIQSRDGATHPQCDEIYISKSILISFLIRYTTHTSADGAYLMIDFSPIDTMNSTTTINQRIVILFLFIISSKFIIIFSVEIHWLRNSKRKKRTKICFTTWSRPVRGWKNCARDRKRTAVKDRVWIESSGGRRRHVLCLFEKH